MRKARKTNSDARWLDAAEVGEKLRAVRDDLKTANILGRAYLGAKQVHKRRDLARKASEGESRQRTGLALLWNFVIAQRAVEEGDGSARDHNPVDAGFSRRAYRSLRYVYETDKQYQQALRIYEKAFAASGDAAIKASIERVRALSSQQP